MDSAAPDSTVVEMLLVPLPPESRVSEVGLAEMEKSFAGGAGWTVSVTVVPCVAPDPVPLTVRLMVSAVPLTSAVEMVLVPVALGARVSEVGLAEMEKSFGGAAPQPGNLNEPIRVFQLKAP